MVSIAFDVLIKILKVYRHQNPIDACQGMWLSSLLDGLKGCEISLVNKSIFILIKNSMCRS